MKYIGIFWIIVFIINIVMVLVSAKLKSNFKILIASLSLIFINFSSYFIFYIITGEYSLPMANIIVYLLLLVPMSPMIFSVILLVVRTHKAYKLSSMICLDIIALNLTFITFMYSYVTADFVDYILLLLVPIYLVVILFLIILVGKWIYLYAVGRKRRY